MRSVRDIRGQREERRTCMIILLHCSCFCPQGLCCPSCLSACCICHHWLCDGISQRSGRDTCRRITAERLRLQGIANRNEEAARERMRVKQEDVAATEAAAREKSQAQTVAKPAGMTFPKLEDMTIEAPTRPPPKAKGGVVSAASSRTPTPPKKIRVASPRPPTTSSPAPAKSVWDTPPPARSPSDELVSVFGDFTDISMAKAKGNGGSKSASAGARQITSQCRGPPKVVFVVEAAIERIPGEIDQEYKCRIVKERYMLVNGETGEEKDMVHFYKQVNGASSRGVISSFTMNVMISRHWGKDHKDTDPSLTNVMKTQKQLSAWMHPDHFKTFCERSKDHHDTLHNG